MYVSNAGFPDVVEVSEYFVTESYKSLTTLKKKNTMLLNIFGSACCASLSAVYKDANNLARFMPGS